MCLAIPSKIVEIEGGMATIDVEGVQRSASLMLLEDAAVGDFVIVHAGFAIQKLDAAAAAESIRLLREAAAMVDDMDPDQG
ncbi:HypC/HybG/HupF family hydrogenase formation chaperone [uncultured Desulfosarcina sp.]|uniref:HypC/HybG/HupF family hydrogenase formation chaperone n=1 Tax=uncultured Desulfosarcina sp. TaxID=218289 RepID=UPI0029C8AF1A|nr:HypC/HybG/HupF family hydrogenase formation chaperone [uncultured Desulfosarcina sp.]